MSRIEPQSAALGAIFEFPNPTSRNSLSQLLADEGFQVNEGSRRQLTLGDSDLEIGEAMHFSPKLAERDGVTIIYNSDATLDGFGNSSFLTAREERTGDLEKVLSTMDEISFIFDELDIDDQLRLFELTFDSAVRVSDEYDFTSFFSTSATNQISDVHGSEVHGLTARFNSNCDATEPGWFRLLIDTSATKNPRRWGVQYQRRYSSYEDISKENIEDALISTVDITKGEN